MKSLRFLLLYAGMATTALAQGPTPSLPAAPRPKLGILSLDAVNIVTHPIILGNMARLEVERQNKYEVLDRYEIMAVLQSKQAESCYGKSCLVEVGKAINADKMLSGSLENYEKKYVLTLRLIDVRADAIERTQVTEFLPLPAEVQGMIELSLRQFFGQPADTLLRRRLTKPNDFDNAINTENAPRLSTSGPRMGYTLLTGTAAQALRRPRADGGFDANPVLFQFGYQFETMYLNTGNWQALFEFIPMISGLDQGLFIPSLTVLNGIRQNVQGWEFALGPNLRLVRQAYGAYDANGQWHTPRPADPAGTQYEYRIDSNGDPRLQTGVVIALGKTFRSGRLNLPVNAFYLPSRHHHQLGISFGFNARKLSRPAGPGLAAQP